MTTSTVYVGMDGWNDQSLPNHVNNQTRGLSLDATGGAQKRAFLWFKLPFHPGIAAEVSEATLTFNLKSDIAGSRTFTAYRVTSNWSARSLCWSRSPDFDSPAATVAQVTISGASAGDEYSIDVTPYLVRVASGDHDWYGLRLTVSTGGPFSIWSQQALNPKFRPRLEVVWTYEPPAPHKLSPAGGRAISVPKPSLGWENPDWGGDETQSAAWVQVSPNADMSNPVFDTGGFHNHLQTEMDTSSSNFDAFWSGDIRDGDDRYWRVRYQNSNGRNSDWSDVAHFTRAVKGTLTIDNPIDGATIEDLTPTVLLGFTGATLDTVAMWVYRVADDGKTWGDPLYTLPRHPKHPPDTSITIPIGFIKNTDRQYRLRVRAWDDADREARPGDPEWVQASVDFTWDGNRAIARIDTLTVDQHADGSPMVDVTFTDDDAPDYYCLVVDGDRPKGYERVLPQDVNIGVGRYRIVYGGAEPYVNSGYRIERVERVAGELKHTHVSTNLPVVHFVSQPVGIWLYDVDQPSSDVLMFGPDHGADFTWGETAGVFYPTGSHGGAERPVILRQSTRGREGTVSGALRDNRGIGAKDYLARLRKIWRTGKEMRLVMGEINIPVVIGEPKDSPREEPIPAYQVEFTVYQVDEFDQ